jgi:hypothetical protein
MEKDAHSGGHPGDTGPAVREHGSVPLAIRWLSTLSHPDYVDFFTVTTDGATDRSAEQWARAMVEAPPARFWGPFVWRVVLGLRLEERFSPDCVGGWKIADRGESWLRVEASSWFLTAHLIFQVDDRQLSFATFVRYDRAGAALVWLPVSMLHRQAVPVLLHYAARDQRSRPALNVRPTAGRP